ncbi:hypothetical protein HETIRDRAFT_327865 [Heterobasidion irregulare TC 32-1]|uniref:Uncharacterized protein n=1 Tax=Heterobasidion irregulare (strain TC 32-1) TaxID=747525 RepID=W4JUD8_HETIT|nr:uncharacterized protein HETIRDRAFT_327865 [Heterobasidion irregulare TC 32-1]ETW76496.1 hypothetical protein HETIRDRAFT_327865 [Heterobasidion irregulare TC 32-1]
MTAEIWSEIPLEQKLKNPNRSTLNNLITANDVLEAIHAAKAGSVAGIDGIPYELWKSLLCKRILQEKTTLDTPCFHVMNTLTNVYQDIQTHEVDLRTNFTLGWMCPIYKKNERTKIENYRPITLLNMDYKLLTRVLTVQLASIIPPLLHENQARFIPGHSIFDQT